MPATTAKRRALCPPGSACVTPPRAGRRMHRPLRVYVAGPYSADDVMGVLANIRTGIGWCLTILQDTGAAVFCPWTDCLIAISGATLEPVSKQALQANSMAWLEASDVVFAVPGWEKSAGTRAEIAVAEAEGIPVITDHLDELKSWLAAHR